MRVRWREAPADIMRQTLYYWVAGLGECDRIYQRETYIFPFNDTVVTFFLEEFPLGVGDYRANTAFLLGFLYIAQVGGMTRQIRETFHNFKFVLKSKLSLIAHVNILGAKESLVSRAPNVLCTCVASWAAASSVCWLWTKCKTRGAGAI